MEPGDLTWLANLRANAELPGTIIVCAGRLRLLPEEIVGMSDAELLALREKFA